MAPSLLLAVPNVSEGRDATAIARIGNAFTATPPARPARPARPEGAGGESGAGTRVRLLDTHSDPDHHRSVYTLAGEPRGLADALVSGAAEAVRSIDVVARAQADPAERGAHPHVGAIDVIPLVYFEAGTRGAACAEALVVADRIASELELPVFVYGELAGGRAGSTRAELRRGGVSGLAARLAADGDGRRGEAGAAGKPRLRPDFGPARLHPTGGATLVAAREPLVAFNLQLAPPATLADARRVAAEIREGGEGGLRGLRAIGVALRGPGGEAVAQVSLNVERPLELPLAEVVRAVRAQARVTSAELVGLAPRAALEGFPPELPMRGFDPDRHLIENALAASARGETH